MPGTGRKVSPRCSANSPGEVWRSTAVGRDDGRRVGGRRPMPASSDVGVDGRLRGRSTRAGRCERVANARRAMASGE